MRSRAGNRRFTIAVAKPSVKCDYRNIVRLSNKRRAKAPRRHQTRGRATAGPIDAGTAARAIDALTGDPNFMTSLARGLAVIQGFTQQKRSLTIAQLSQRTGHLPRGRASLSLYARRARARRQRRRQDLRAAAEDPEPRSRLSVVDDARDVGAAAARPRERSARRVVVDRAARRRRDPVRRALVDDAPDHVGGPVDRHPPARVLHVDGARAARAPRARTSSTATFARVSLGRAHAAHADRAGTRPQGARRGARATGTRSSTRSSSSACARSRCRCATSRAASWRR